MASTNEDEDDDGGGWEVFGQMGGQQHTMQKRQKLEEKQISFATLTHHAVSRGNCKTFKS